MCDISVVIATFNRPNYMKKTLESMLLLKKTDFTCEIIIVDNNATYNTEEVVQPFVSKFLKKDINLRLIYEKNSGTCFARNKGINEAEGEIIAITDDDVIVSSMWLENIRAAFRKYKCAGMAGKLIPIYPENMPSWLKGKFIPLGIARHDYGNDVLYYTQEMCMPNGASSAFKKNALIKYGLFDVNLGPGAEYHGEDGEIVKKMLKNGEKIIYFPSAIVFHPLREDHFKKKFFYEYYYKMGKTYVTTSKPPSTQILILSIIRTWVALCLTLIKFILTYCKTVDNRKFQYKVRMNFLLGKNEEYFKLLSVERQNA